MSNTFGHMTTQQLLDDQHATLYTRRTIREDHQVLIGKQRMKEAAALAEHIQFLQDRHSAIIRELRSRSFDEEFQNHVEGLNLAD